MNTKRYIKEIGGDFTLNDIKNITINKHKDNKSFSKGTILIDSGRSAFKYLLKNIRYDKTVLLPDYLCESILLPLNEYNIKYIFYKINEDLSIDIEDLTNKIKKDVKLIYLIKYFGFDFNKEEYEFIYNTDTKIILDTSHSLIEKNPNFSYVLGSLRKLLPVPDGGFLITKEKIKRDRLQDPKYNKYLALRIKAMNLKSLFLNEKRGNKSEYLNAFEMSEKYLDRQKQMYHISPLTEDTMYLLDFDKIRKIRKQNFSYLMKNIGLPKINKKIRSEDIIYKFPFMVDSRKRDKIFNFMIKNRVYVSKHWDFLKGMDTIIHQGTYNITSRMIAIPIDHRYDMKDMERIVGLLKRYV